MSSIPKFKQNLVFLINSHNNSVPRGYDKRSAIENLEKLRLIFRLAQDLEYPSVRSIAKAFNTTPTTLYAEYERVFGHKFTKGLSKYELAIRKRSESGLSQINKNSEKV